MSTILLNTVLDSPETYTQELIKFDCIQRVAVVGDNATALKTTEGRLLAIVALPFAQVCEELSQIRNYDYSDLMETAKEKGADWAKRCIKQDWRDVTVKSEAEFKAATGSKPAGPKALSFPGK